MNPQTPSSSAAEAGRLDALSRRKASSAHPDYQTGYLEGLFERAAEHSVASFRDRTVTGMIIEALTTEDGASYYLRSADGQLITKGAALDIESAIAAAEGDIAALGQPTARLSQMAASVRSLDPDLPEDAVQRVVAKAAAYMVEFREGRQG